MKVCSIYTATQHLVINNSSLKVQSQINSDQNRIPETISKYQVLKFYRSSVKDSCDIDLHIF